MATIRDLVDTEKRIAVKWRKRVLEAQKDLALAQERLNIVVDAWKDLPSAFGHAGAKINEQKWTLEDG